MYVRLFVRLSVCLSVCQYVCLSASMYVGLSLPPPLSIPTSSHPIIEYLLDTLMTHFPLLLQVNI